MKLVDESVLDKFRGERCELCHLRAGEPHHIRAKGMGGGGRCDHPFNLVSLCRPCHTAVHNGSISREFLSRIVAEREDVSRSAMCEYLDWLLRQSKDRPVGAQT